MNTNRKVLKDVTALLCGRNTYVLCNKTQFFCETPKSFEIWDSENSLEFRVTRISKSKVFFVSTDPEFLPKDEWILEREALLQK